MEQREAKTTKSRGRDGSSASCRRLLARHGCAPAAAQPHKQHRGPCRHGCAAHASPRHAGRLARACCQAAGALAALEDVLQVCILPRQLQQHGVVEVLVDGHLHWLWWVKRNMVGEAQQTSETWSSTITLVR